MNEDMKQITAIKQCISILNSQGDCPVNDCVLCIRAPKRYCSMDQVVKDAEKYLSAFTQEQLLELLL